MLSRYIVQGLLSVEFVIVYLLISRANHYWGEWNIVVSFLAGFAVRPVITFLVPND